MHVRTIRILIAGILVLAVVSLVVGMHDLRGLYRSWPPPWKWIGEVAFPVLTVLSLVSSTGLARGYGLGRVRTGALAFGLGLVVLLAASVLVEALWPSWRHLMLPSFPQMVTFEHDAAWIAHKVVECSVYVLPFAAWRALKHRPPVHAQAS